MKTLSVRLISLLVLFAASIASGQPQRTEVPGDHFSLEGALELFKQSKSPQEFEKLLNSQDGKVNNLDLNGDGDIDYVRVIDKNEGSVHAFILQAIVSDTESQDIAVIELEKLSNGKAVLQITGDADVYGIETIIEPTEEVRVNAGTSTARSVVNVWTWPAVQYVYDPYYTVWVSPWGWYTRPFWWSPWRPVAYYVYNPWWVPYRPYYSACYTHRVIYAPHIYRPYRTTSVIVYNRYNTQLTDYRKRPDVRHRENAIQHHDRTSVSRVPVNDDRQRSYVQDRQRKVSDQERITSMPSDLSKERTHVPVNKRSSSSRELTAERSAFNRTAPATQQHREVDLSRFRSTGSGNNSPRERNSGSTHLQRGHSMDRPSIQPRSNNHGGVTKSSGHKRGKN